MKKSVEVGLIMETFAALTTLAGVGLWHIYRKGCRDGAKNREKEILIDYVSYIPLSEIGDVAESLMEDGVSEDYPMLVIRSDKYDYLDETDPNGVAEHLK